MKRLICVVGPTASGKTEISIKLAHRLNGEIVGADSMQIYKDVSIASAKPTPDELGGVAYHMIDFAEITHSYSAAQYQVIARETIDDIINRNKTPLLVGGTGMYINAVIFDMKFADTGNDYEYRKHLQNLEKTNPGSVYDILKKTDSEAAERLSPNDIQRIIRALEVKHISEAPMSAQNDGYKDKKLYDTIVFGLTYPREVLYKRIERRVDQMMQNGLLDEIESIYDAGYQDTTGLKFLGFKEFSAYYRKEISMDGAIILLKRNSRRYAKRQLTWFRHMDGVTWMDLADYASTDDAVSYMINLIKNKWDWRVFYE